MTGRAEQRGERAAGCSSREPPGAAAKGADPWQIAVAGLQANCLQFGANLARLQQQAASGLARLQQQARAPAPAARRRSAGGLPVASLSSAAAAPTSEPSSWSGGSAGAASSSTASREEVGRATWTFLHTLAAQYPEHPTRQQKRDARNLVGGMEGLMGLVMLWLAWQRAEALTLACCSSACESAKLAAHSQCHCALSCPHPLPCSYDPRSPPYHATHPPCRSTS